MISPESEKIADDFIEFIKTMDISEFQEPELPAKEPVPVKEQVRIFRKILEILE